MKNSTEIKKSLTTIQNEIVKSLQKIIGKNSLELHSGIIVVNNDDFDDDNECIVGINEDLMVDIEHCYEIDKNAANITDYPIHIQICLLEMLEQGKFAVA